MSTNGAAPKANSKRFELPALEFNFKPLTDGTDIPPPPPSPVKETLPENALADENKENKAAKTKEGANGAANGQKNTNGTVIQTTVTAGTKRPADDLSSPLSPALSSRQGSIRRLFSRTLLNNTYVEGEPGAVNGQTNGGGRPGSRSNTSILDEKKAKRSSGWFRRLRSGNDSPANKRSSAILFDESNKKPTGPPPPMIPELSALEAKVDVANEGSLGADDMFKNIK